MAFHELSYQAASWSAARRIVLVLQQAPGELFPQYFFLLTNWPADQTTAVALLDMYRQRGKAEGHFGELMSVLGPALSSTRRKKSHYRGQVPKCRYVAQEPFAANEVKLLLNALAYTLAHTARCLLEEVTGQGWSLGRFLERALRVSARVLLHARRVVVVINSRSAVYWRQIWAALGQLCWLAPPPRA